MPTNTQGLKNRKKIKQIKFMTTMFIVFLHQVSTSSLAANIGLRPNDFLNSIAGQEAFNMTHDEVW